MLIDIWCFERIFYKTFTIKEKKRNLFFLLIFLGNKNNDTRLKVKKKSKGTKNITVENTCHNFLSTS